MEPADVLKTLTSKQLECLRRYAARNTAKQIGKALGITHHAVEKHLAAVRQKFRVETTLEAVRLLERTTLTVEPYYGSHATLAALICPHASADTRELAGRLLDEFGTLSAVLAGSAMRIARAGGSRDLHDAFAANRRAMVAALRERLDDRPLLATGQDLINYLWLAMAHEPREYLRVLYLDLGHRLLCDEVLRTGSLDTIHVEPRDVMVRALELSAVGTVLAHNHPSGDPTPSEGDQRITQRIANAGHYLGIRVLAHFVVARAGSSEVRIYSYPP